MTSNLPLVVQKFGGTSVGSIERIRAVADLVARSCEKQKNVVVVSAMSGTTNQLVKWGHELSENPLPEAFDMLLASGEQVTCALLAIALKEKGIQSIPLLGFQAGIETDDLYSKAHIQKINPEILTGYLDRGVLPVVAGFQGVHRKADMNFITTLGRGGSDTSAVAIAAALKANRCDIYTDVPGVFSADPRVVPEAKCLNAISFSEMMELASLGAKVLHMRCLEIAAKYRVPLRVLSTFEPEKEGTLVMNDEDLLETPVVSAVTSDSGEALIEITLDSKSLNFPAKVFSALSSKSINVDVIVRSPSPEAKEGQICFTVPRAETKTALEILSSYKPRILNPSIVKVSIVGIGMRTHSGVAARMFEALERAGIPIALIITSEIKVSVIIDEALKQKAVQVLHKEFQLEG